MNSMKILPCLGLGLLLLAFPAAAKDVLQGCHITVSGAGSVSARPDLAIAELGVTAHGETATLAMSQNR